MKSEAERMERIRAVKDTAYNLVVAVTVIGLAIVVMRMGYKMIDRQCSMQEGLVKQGYIIVPTSSKEYNWIKAR